MDVNSLEQGLKVVNDELRGIKEDLVSGRFSEGERIALRNVHDRFEKLVNAIQALTFAPVPTPAPAPPGNSLTLPQVPLSPIAFPLPPPLDSEFLQGHFVNHITKVINKLCSGLAKDGEEGSVWFMVDVGGLELVGWPLPNSSTYTSYFVTLLMFYAMMHFCLLLLTAEDTTCFGKIFESFLDMLYEGLTADNLLYAISQGLDSAFSTSTKDLLLYRMLEDSKGTLSRTQRLAVL
jgi:hypothetical protein